MAVCMVPLAVYGLEIFFKIFPEADEESYSSFYHVVKGSWIWMELATIAAGLFALRYYAFPFLTAPIFFAAWFLSMDLIPILIGEEASFTQKAWVSLFFGTLILAIAYLIDLKKMPQYAFWGYLFGTITFWVSLSSLCVDKGEAVLFLYLLVNISMMIKSVLLQRKVLLVFGALGTFSYFGHLAYDLFESSVLFPFAMTLLGLAVIYLGVLYQKNSQWIETKILSVLPAWVKKMLPQNLP